MKNFATIVFLGFLFASCGGRINEGQTAEMAHLYHSLDSLIEIQADIIAAKKARVQTIKEGMHSIKLTMEQEIHQNNLLYDEYLAFNFDSAYHYIKKNIDLFRNLPDADLAASGRIRMSHILAVSGLFDKADYMLDSVPAQQLSKELLVEYYNQRAELNLYRSEMAQYSPYFREYNDSALYYRQLILQIAPHDSYDYIVNQANYACARGDVAEAIRIFEDYLPSLSPSQRSYSIVTSTLAFFYDSANQHDRQEYYLLLSAISDMQGAILENKSLRELSMFLLKRGDNKKAYNYLQQASMDAKRYGSRLRSVQVAHLAPLITQTYDMERTQTQQRTNRLLLCLTLISILLIATIFYTLSLVRKRRLANEQIRRMNAQLNLHNREMQQLNVQMKEANRIKDEYIGRFLELCSDFIQRGEDRVKYLNRLARNKKMPELYNELKSLAPITENIHQFHQNFDTAFLNIYPNFIDEVNRLMTKENRFEISKNPIRLTTELRVLALIRLGIADNQEIADILRSSITTIYTYRSKLKSRAISKESFEDDIRRIATY